MLPLPYLKQSVKDRLGPLPADSSEPNQDSSVASQNAFKSNLSVKERLGFASKPGSTPSGPVFSTSTGLTKTVYNMAALKAAQKTALFAGVIATEEAMKNKQEALRLQQEMRKKKQEILEKHIETQKLLICKLEKSKTMKAEDKAVIMTTLGTLTKSITELQQEIKGISNSSGLRGAPKSKAQVFLNMQQLQGNGPLSVFRKPSGPVHHPCQRPTWTSVITYIL
uniref:RNA binding motif protein 26 n=1 Tax=Hucho hucho TaxID=62062 RepID=A0A4W5M8W3_9TELE